MAVEDVFSITGRGTVATGRVERGTIKIGDNIGILLRGVQKRDVQRGVVLAEPGSITPHTYFEAQVYVLKKEEGGRHTPFFVGYRPQFYVRTTDVTGTVVDFASERVDFTKKNMLDSNA